MSFSQTAACVSAKVEESDIAAFAARGARTRSGIDVAGLLPFKAGRELKFCQAVCRPRRRHTKRCESHRRTIAHHACIVSKRYAALARGVQEQNRKIFSSLCILCNSAGFDAGRRAKHPESRHRQSTDEHRIVMIHAPESQFPCLFSVC